MAEIKHASGVKLLVKIGDGESPEQFTTYCSINAERGITFTAGTNDQDIPDCDDPEKIAWVLREKSNLSAAITGSGVVNTPDIQKFYDFLVSPLSKNAKVILDVPSAVGGVIFGGKFHLTEFSVTGNRGEKCQANISLSSDGEITSAPNT